MYTENIKDEKDSVLFHKKVKLVNHIFISYVLFQLYLTFY